jgi:hypothetical protein
LKTQFVYHRQTLLEIYNENKEGGYILGKSRVNFPQIPAKEDLSDFVLSYRPSNEDIDMHTLIKANFSAIEYSERELYIGEMIGKHKSGIGILITRRSCFEGEWKNN